MLNRTRVKLLTALVVGAVSLLPGWRPAEAQEVGVQGTNPNTCEDVEVCLWENNDFNQGNTNHCLQFTADDSSYTNNTWWQCTSNTSTTDGMNDEASSFRNDFNFTSVDLCRNSNFGTPCSRFGPNTQDGFLSNNDVGDNAASSHNLL